MTKIQTIISKIFLAILLITATTSKSQTLFWEDDFENATSPNLGGGIRAASVNFTFGGPPATRYFTRTLPSGINTVLPALSGFQGSYIWAAEDVDNGSTQSEQQNITWSGINISGRNNLIFKGLFAAGGGTGVWDSSPLVALVNDYVIVEYRIDAGPWQNGVRFFPANNTVSSTLAQELTGDSLAMGEGPNLTTTFTEYTFNLSGTGTTLDIRMKLHANSASEEAMIDDFRVYEGVSCPTVTASIAQTNVACNGGANGSATVTASGGAPFTYAWSPSGGSSLSASGLIAGNYTCVVTNSCGATSSKTITITQPSAISLTPLSQTNISCNGGSNGAASVNAATGGAGGFTYNWTPGNPTGDGTTSVTGLTASTWSCTVTDVNSCTRTQTFNISQPTVISLTQLSQTNVSCNGGSNGAASVNAATGGAGGFTYNWTPGNPTGDGTTSVTGLTAGSWTCTTTDANSCTASTVFNITQPAAISLTSSSQTNVSCNGGSNGAASVNAATGGAGGFTYNWTPGNPTGDGTTSVTGLTAGSWTCTTTDANSCTASTVFNITQPASALATSTTVSNVTCFGGSNGSATVTTTGGTGAYSYLWNTAATTSVITSQTIGTKSYTVTDANGCTSSGNVVISQPTQISANIGSNPTSCTGNTGSAAVSSPAGGVGGYTYSWAPVGGTTNTATGLGVGNYTCTVSDANSCSITKTVSVITASGPSLTSLAQTNISCFGGSNGAASVNAATGGSTPYTYNWTPGNPTGDGTTSVTGLTAQVYTCTVTDANGCSASQSFNITQPASALATSTAVTNVACFGNSTGSATITATGGTAGYTYLWSIGATTSVITSQTAGVKTATVTDANGCTSIKSVSINQPASALSTSTAVTNVACFGNSTGSATITVTGGTTSYSYIWGTGATTSVITSQASGTKSYTVTDANGCTATGNAIISQPASALATSTAVTNVLCFGNSTGAATITATGGTAGYSYLWSTGATTSVITSQTAGVKTATVTDANGCTSIKSVSISQPASALATSTAVANVACFGNSTGSATITATGGTASYSYLWSTGATTSVITSQTAGIKTATVTDANSCTSVKSVSISQPTSALATSTAVTNVLCNGGSTGSATIIATGGTSAYTYLWSTGATTSVITFQTAGVKTATITDANGCTSVNSVSILEPTLLTATTTQTNTTCNGVCDGTATVTPNGGTAPYTFNWSNGSTSSTNNSLCAGVYTVTVTDANGCTTNQITTITEPTAVIVSAVSGNILCNGGSTSVTVTAAGGTGTYTGTGSFTQTAGTYTYTVTDANACSTNTVITITEPNTLNATISGTNTNCNSNTGIASVNVSGGTVGYLYSWSPTGGNNSIASGLAADGYVCTITDANGCVKTIGTTIGMYSNPSIVPMNQNTSCNSVCDGSISINAAGPSSNFTYMWSPNVSNNDIASNLCAGEYTCKVVDDHGCADSISITISEPAILIADILATPILCNGDNSSITVSATGGSVPYTGTGIFIASAGSHSYTVTDAHGCTTNTTITITEPSLISVTQTITLCYGQSITVGSNTYNSTGIYTDILSSINGCDSSITSNININTPIDVSTSVNGLTIYANEINATYQWIDCDNANLNIISAINQSYTVPSNGNYAVIVTQNTCSDTSACVNISTVGIKENNALNSVSIYPNPTNGIITINGLFENSIITVYNSIGQQVFKSSNTNTNVEINLERETPGIYIIQIANSNSEITKKIIKQ